MFIVVLLYRVCTNMRLEILAMSLSIHACVVVEGMYICKTRPLSRDTSCSGLCVYKGYVHLYRGYVHM